MELPDTEAFYDSVRHFTVKDRRSVDDNTELIRRFATNARNLRTLVLARNGYGSFDLSILSNLSSLSTLQLTGGAFTFKEHAPLPNLNCLIVDHNALPVPLPLLSPTFLPNLAHLSLSEVYGDWAHALLQGSNFSALVPQIRSLNVHWTLAIARPDYLKECTDRTLFNCSLFDLSNFSKFANNSIDVRHLRILHLMHAPGNSFFFQMARLIRWIDAQSHDSLHSLYLDSSLNPVGAETPVSATPMKALLQICKDKKVEIVFERQVSELGVDFAHSEEFCGRQRERRRLE
ncbi:hypothetical protein JCM5353_000404 [Sporobolomyces roseus]